MHSSELGAYWEFSYYHYDIETGEMEKVEACQPKPAGRKTELRLKVTCREERRNEVDNNILKKNHKGGEENSKQRKQITGQGKAPDRTSGPNHGSKFSSKTDVKCV